MTKCADDYTLLTPALRMRKALTAMHAAAIPMDLAVAYVALSEGETGYNWGETRPLEKYASCCAQPVGLEPGQLQRWTKSPLFVRWVNQHGGGINVQASGALTVPGLDLQRNALWFEWGLANRDMNVVTAFSIGPTQINLGLPRACGWPLTIDDITAFYLTTDIQTVMNKYLVYLTPARFNAKGCLGVDSILPNGTEQVGVNWLSHHVGDMGDAKILWDGGTKFGVRRAYKTVWQEVRAAAIPIFGGV